MTLKRIEFEIEVNESGVGFVEPLARGVHLSCRAFVAGREVPLVEINGSDEGLRWLAAKILAVASSEPAGYHVHVAEDEGLRGNCELLIAKTKP
jgi:hypothetical protein